jgi:hypothetical protein
MSTHGAHSDVSRDPTPKAVASAAAAVVRVEVAAEDEVFAVSARSPKCLRLFAVA